jgi:hypothetical protein
LNVIIAGNVAKVVIEHGGDYIFVIQSQSQNSVLDMER